LKTLAPVPAAKSEQGLETLPPGPRIEPGSRHPDIAVIRRRLGIIGTAHDETLYDDRVVAAVRGYMKFGRRNIKPVIDERVRAAFNNPSELATAKQPESIDAKKILVNMERWRWLPDEIGELHIWNSLTEFETKVVKAGEVIHQERIIIGKPDTQTPIFSQKMAYVVFQPEWGVPNSIKVKQLLPALQDGNDGVLDERGMKILVNGREKDPGDYNWDKTDIRYVPVYQLPGPSNPLGQVKFMFPNKHDVYMHDTPQKSLFNDSRRTHSHGCIRVRNPRKLAELIMKLDQGWGESEVAAVLQPRAKPSNRIELKSQIPVHNTYFTVFADAEGNLRSVADIYSHDKRISDALDGVPVEVIARRDPARVLEQELEEIAPTRQSDGGTIIMKSEKQKLAARRNRSNDYDDDTYAPSGKPQYQGYSALGYAPPQQFYFAPPKPTNYAPPKPTYSPPVKKGNSFRSPTTLYDAVNTYGR
ncbi:MAG: L,D-transpeptidase family protein, partial [Hyphomicrobium sp.]